jgi:hypothetical protein
MLALCFTTRCSKAPCYYVTVIFGLDNPFSVVQATPVNDVVNVLCVLTQILVWDVIEGLSKTLRTRSFPVRNVYHRL